MVAFHENEEIKENVCCIYFLYNDLGSRQIPKSTLPDHVLSSL
jgi:hypothetical protein